jgi:hypothetical protein
MALRGIVASAASLLILTGCVSQVQLANDKGQTAQCNAAGLGVLTAVAAGLGQKKCIDQYQSQGYHQVPLPTSTAAATATTTDGKPQADQCNTYGGGTLIKEQMQQACTGAPVEQPAPAWNRPND